MDGGGLEKRLKSKDDRTVTYTQPQGLLLAGFVYDIFVLIGELQLNDMS